MFWQLPSGFDHGDETFHADPTWPTCVWRRGDVGRCSLTDVWDGMAGGGQLFFAILGFGFHGCSSESESRITLQAPKPLRHDCFEAKEVAQSNLDCGAGAWGWGSLRPFLMFVRAVVPSHCCKFVVCCMMAT